MFRNLNEAGKCVAAGGLLAAVVLIPLHVFTRANGADPVAGLVEDDNGSLYGTTELGGLGSDCPSRYEKGCGTVFKVKK